jgi:membrane-bound lytic murein transglycosylase D
VLARLADTTVAAMLELNPQFVRGITPPQRAVVVRVPRGMGARVAERYAELPVNERITFVDHYVTSGQTLSSIAQRYKVTVTMLQAANPHLRAHALRIGQRIIVPMSGRVVPRGAWSTPPEPRVRRTSSRYRNVSASSGATRHRVAAGETASGIARQHGVGLAALLEANDLTMRSVIRPGDVLRIPSR